MSEETSLFGEHYREIFNAVVKLGATVLLGALSYLGSGIVDGLERLELNHSALVERVRVNEIAAIGDRSTIVGLVERLTRLEQARERQIRDMELLRRNGR